MNKAAARRATNFFIRASNRNAISGASGSAVPPVAAHGEARYDAPMFLAKRLAFSLLTLAPFAYSATPAKPDTAGDWPQFLGPHANSTSDETGLLEKWPVGGPPLVWDKPLGTGYSAPSVRGDLLVVHHRIENEEIVEAWHAATGRPVWRHAYESNFRDPFGYNNGPRCTPLLTENRCYTFGAEGVLICLDLPTGKLIWRRDTAKDWEIPEPFFGVGSTPLLEEGKLIVQVGGQPNSGVVAFDAQTGKTLWESVGEKNWQGQPKIGSRGEAPVDWKRHDKQASYSSPVAATIHGQRHILCLMRQGLVSLDPNTGAVNFSFWFRCENEYTVNAINPVVLDDLVFLSSSYYKLGSVVLRVAPDGKGVKQLWRDTVLEIHFTTPVLLNGLLYAFSGRNEPDADFRCVDFRTGELKWIRDEKWQHGSTKTPDKYGRGSAILADGKLIVLGEGGLLGLFKPNPKQDEEVSRFQVPQLQYPSWAAPVLSRGKLYLRSENRLVCLNIGK